MTAKQLLKEIPENEREAITHFITEKMHPDEVETTNEVRVVVANKNSQFDRILFERERVVEENQTRQETAIVGLTAQSKEKGDEITTFIGAWDPDGFKAELSTPKPPKGHAMEMA